MIDFRSIFTENEDYANAIEPASQGGLKIVANIINVLVEHDFNRKVTSIYSI